eukprot:TRINITY_DN3485_c0_g3_i1.p3 TRINITY_DN3485_c0_g3~~TRINITY_DN3485_c0_g3_i1.p3  ORF type:complete len:314 (-),score=59.19 TRINITY_DN3485_c0_g3_i1:2005-2946(-)
MEKAICSVLSAKREAAATKSSKAITNVTAMRGHVMELSLLLGNVFVHGVEVSFAGDKPHMDGGSGERGWDPIVDGGASIELVELLRGVFDLRSASRSIALTIEEVADDLRRRVPNALMRRVHEVVVDVLHLPAALPLASAAAQDGSNLAMHDSRLQAADEQRGVKRRRQSSRSQGSDSFSSTECTSDADAFETDDDDGCDLPQAAPRPSKKVWDRNAPLLAYGEALEEPALASTGGARGEERLRNVTLPLLPLIPSAAASTLKVMEFVRAMFVDPVYVWKPQGSWTAVDKVAAVLRSNHFFFYLSPPCCARLP